MSEEEMGEAKRRQEEIAAKLAAEKEGGYDLPPPPSPNGHIEEVPYTLGQNGEVWNPILNTPAPEGAKIPALTAILIVQEKDGKVWGTGDLTVLDKINFARPATMLDFIPMLSQVISDVEMMKIVQQTVNAMMATSQAVMEQQRNQEMVQKLGNRGFNIPRR